MPTTPNILAINRRHSKHRIVPQKLGVLLVAVEKLVLVAEVVVGRILSRLMDRSNTIGQR